MEKQQAISEFILLCKSTPAHEFNVLHRFDKNLIKLGNNFSLRRRPLQLAYYKYQNNTPVFYSLTEEEHKQLQQVWYECAKVKFAIQILRKKDITNEEPHITDVGYDAYYLEEKNIEGETYVADPAKAKRFETMEEAKQNLILCHAQKYIYVVEIGVGAN